MDWLDNIRKQPHHKKISLIWTITAVVFVFLIALWIISYKYQKKTPHDTSFFDTVGRGFHDVKTNINDIPNYVNTHQ